MEQFWPQFKRRAFIFLASLGGGGLAIVLGEKEIIPSWLAVGASFVAVLAGFGAILYGGFIFKPWPPGLGGKNQGDDK